MVWLVKDQKPSSDMCSSNPSTRYLSLVWSLDMNLHVNLSTTTTQPVTTTKAYRVIGIINGKKGIRYAEYLLDIFSLLGKIVNWQSVDCNRHIYCNHPSSKTEFPQVFRDFITRNIYGKLKLTRKPEAYGTADKALLALYLLHLNKMWLKSQ